MVAISMRQTSISHKYLRKIEEDSKPGQGKATSENGKFMARGRGEYSVLECQNTLLSRRKESVWTTGDQLSKQYTNEGSMKTHRLVNDGIAMHPKGYASGLFSWAQRGGRLGQEI